MKNHSLKRIPQIKKNSFIAFLLIILFLYFKTDFENKIINITSSENSSSENTVNSQEEEQKRFFTKTKLDNIVLYIKSFSINYKTLPPIMFFLLLVMIFNTVNNIENNMSGNSQFHKNKYNGNTYNKRKTNSFFYNVKNKLKLFFIEIFKIFIKKQPEDEQRRNNDDGKKAEEKFINFLNENHKKGDGEKSIPFLYIDQTEKYYAKQLSYFHARRPDFIVFTKSGAFLVDVKSRTKKPFNTEQKERLYLNQEEIITLYNLQEQLHMSVLIAFIDKDNLNNPEKENHFNKNLFTYSSISDIYDYYSKVSDILKNKHDEIYGKHFKRFRDREFTYNSEKHDDERQFVYIPDWLIYYDLSSEKGFYKKHNDDFYKEEAGYYNDFITKRTLNGGNYEHIK